MFIIFPISRTQWKYNLFYRVLLDSKINFDRVLLGLKNQFLQDFFRSRSLFLSFDKEVDLHVYVCVIVPHPMLNLNLVTSSFDVESVKHLQIFDTSMEKKKNNVWLSSLGIDWR